MSDTWKQERISIAQGVLETRDGRVVGWTRENSVEIDAVVSGVFGVHKNNGAYTVTHVPTGHKIVWDIPTLARAKQFCRDIKDLTDWTSLSAPEKPLPIPPEIREPLLAAWRKTWVLAATPAAAQPTTGAALTPSREED